MICTDSDRLIAKGGFGEVYRVEYGGHQLAQKIIDQDLKQLSQVDIVNFFQKVFKEINVMHLIATLQSERLLKIRGISFDISKQRIASIAIYTDLMARDLNSCIKEGVQSLSKQRKVSIVKQITEGLRDMQEAKLIHGDIKPQNILLDKQFNAKIADFGTVQLQQHSVTMVSGQDIVLTPLYAPPEYISQRIKNRGTDIWSLGGLVLKLFTGMQPYCDIQQQFLVRHLVQGRESVFEHFVRSERCKEFVRELDQEIKDIIEGCTYL